MSGRLQIVLGANQADNLRACIRALMTHPEVHWAGKRLALFDLRTVWLRTRVAEHTEEPEGLGGPQWELTPHLGHIYRQEWFYRGPHRAFQREEFYYVDGARRPGRWAEYHCHPHDALVFRQNIDKTTMTLLLAEAADFVQVKRRKTVPVSAPASLIKLLLEVGSYEPFPWLGTYRDYNIRNYPELLVHDPDHPVLWVPQGQGLEAYNKLHEKRLQSVGLGGSAALDPAEPSDRLTSSPHPGFVYFIGRADGEGLVKIGYSADPQRRLGDLQTGSPVELAIIDTVPGSEDFEQELHARLSANRRHGEWFERHAALELLTQLRRGDR